MKILVERGPFYEIEVPEEMGSTGTHNIIRRVTSKGGRESSSFESEGSDCSFIFLLNLSNA